MQMRACRTRRGAGNQNLSATGLEAARPPVPRPFVCCRVYCFRSENQKSRSLAEAARAVMDP